MGKGLRVTLRPAREVSMTTQTVNTGPKLLENVRTALGLTSAGPHYFFRRHSAVVRIAHWRRLLSNSRRKRRPAI